MFGSGESLANPQFSSLASVVHVCPGFKRSVPLVSIKFGFKTGEEELPSGLGKGHMSIITVFYNDKCYINIKANGAC
jgi:hypothetical protein